MKTTSKILIAVIALFIISSSATFAKGGGGNGRFSVGVEGALPMGTFGDEFNFGFGGSVRYEMPSGNNLAFTGTVGYRTFAVKSSIIDAEFGTGSGVTEHFNVIPIMVGAKYYFMEQQSGFYVAVALGLSLETASVSGGGESVSTSSSDFTYAPGVGYHLDNIDLGVNYNVIATSGSSTGSLDLRVAYVFGAR